jgi:hypothetical protein
MMKSKHLFLIFIFLYILAGVVSFRHTYYNDPDSYYYLSISEGKIQSDGTLLGYVLSHFGLFAGHILLMIFGILGSWMIYDIVDSNITKRWSWISGTIYLFTPLSFYINGWYGRMDKNIITMFLFTLFFIIHAYFFYDRKFSQTIMGRRTIGWVWMYGLMMILFYGIAMICWQGYKLFFCIMLLYWSIYMTLDHYKSGKFSRNKTIFLMMFFVFGSMTIMYAYMRQESMNLIMETIFTPIVLFVTEFLILIWLMFRLYKSVQGLYDSLMIMGIISILVSIIFPRMMNFLVPIYCIYLGIGLESLDKMEIFVLLAIISIPCLVSSVSYSTFFSEDYFYDINNMKDICINENTTIISDWSYGYIYQHKFRCNVKFMGHPANINDELDYLYYRNKSCTNCVLLYHPDDYSRFEIYASKLRMNHSNILKNMSRINYEIFT